MEFRQFPQLLPKGEEKEEVNEANEVKIDVGEDKAAKALDSPRPYAEPSTAQLTRMISKGKGMEEVNEANAANEVKMDVGEDNAAKALDSPRPYAEPSTAQVTRMISKGKGMEEVNEANAANEVKMDIGEDNVAEALDPPPPYAEASTAQLTRMISKVRYSAKPKCFMQVVHDGLKQPDENDIHYKPLLLSIGPYHYGDHFLQNMLKHKVHYLEVLLARKNESGRSRYAEALKNEGVESQALDCYVDTFRMNGDDFGECLALDGLFMLELFRKNGRPAQYEKDTTGKDMLFSIRWMKPCLARDLLLFENQLPLFVLYKLFEMTEESPSTMEFIKLALGYFEFSGRPIPDDTDLTNKLDDIPHLLGLVYHALVPEMPNQSNKEWESRVFIRTAVALQEVGIKFEKENSGRFYRISFSPKDGVLRIPRLVIDDNTESFFRNLVAYELYSEDYSLHQVTDYLRFMDCLINSAKDVELLRHCGIIDNRTGDDVKVSTMFNKFCTGVYFDQNKFLYAEMFDEVNEFCNKPWNVRVAKLKNDYFGSPWSVISFLAATTLLVLTILQTVFAGISTF